MTKLESYQDIPLRKKDLRFKAKMAIFNNDF